MNEVETKVAETSQATTEGQVKQNKFNAREAILQFWPLFVAIAGRGGILGFLFAGLAVFANNRILQSQLPQSQKFMYCIATGIAAIVAYVLVAPIVIRLIS